MPPHFQNKGIKEFVERVTLSKLLNKLLQHFNFRMKAGLIAPC